jgi:hypothetical protein
VEEGERHRGRRASGYGSAPEEVTKRRSKWRSNRSIDDRAINASEESRASGSAMELWQKECGVRLELTLTAPLSVPLLYSPALNPIASGPHWPQGPPAGPLGLDSVPLWARPVLVAGPVSFKEIDPLLLLFFFLFLLY